MFVDPLVLNTGTAATASFALNGISPNGATRATDNGVKLTIDRQISKENPLAGGTLRIRLRTDSQVVNGESNPIGSAFAQVIIGIPNPETPSDHLASAVYCLQVIVSHLLAETDGSLSTDATLDSTVLTRLSNGEA